jgi:hypothetical protein
MTVNLTNAVCSTRLRRVQFGVPPNCIGGRATVLNRTNHGILRPLRISGVTPETTRETRVLHHFSLCPAGLAVQIN